MLYSDIYRILSALLVLKLNVFKLEEENDKLEEENDKLKKENDKLEEENNKFKSLLFKISGNM